MLTFVTFVIMCALGSYILVNKSLEVVPIFIHKLFFFNVLRRFFLDGMGLLHLYGLSSLTERDKFPGQRERFALER